MCADIEHAAERIDFEERDWCGGIASNCCDVIRDRTWIWFDSNQWGRRNVRVGSMDAGCVKRVNRIDDADAVPTILQMIHIVRCVVSSINLQIACSSLRKE